MQKLSGILPSSARITSVDMRGSGAARPGSPSYGRPVGESNLEKNAIVRHAHRALKRHREMVDARSQVQVNSDIVKNLSDGFFKSHAQKATENAVVNSILADEMAAAGPAPRIDVPESEPYVDIDKFMNPSMESNESMTEVELDSPGVGRYLNVSA